MNMENINPGGFTIITPDHPIMQEMMERFLTEKDEESGRNQFEVKLMSITNAGGRICLLIKWVDHTGKYYIIFQESLRFPSEFSSRLKEHGGEDTDEEEEEPEKNPFSV